MTLTTELWVNADGRHVEVHERRDDCVEHGCCIHNPSDHHMRDWPLYWRSDASKMERICPHGVGHPDPDATAFRKRRGIYEDWQDVHGCDGCCHVHA